MTNNNNINTINTILNNGINTEADVRVLNTFINNIDPMNMTTQVVASINTIKSAIDAFHSTYMGYENTVDGTSITA